MDTTGTRVRLTTWWPGVREWLLRPMHYATVRKLRAAGTNGDLAEVRSLLHPDINVVVVRDDDDRPTMRVVHGVDEASDLLLRGLASGPDVVVQEGSVNSQAGLMISRSGTPVASIAVDLTGALISLVWVRIDPVHLRHWNTVYR